MQANEKAKLSATGNMSVISEPVRRKLASVHRDGCKTVYLINENNVQ